MHKQESAKTPDHSDNDHAHGDTNSGNETPVCPVPEESSCKDKCATRGSKINELGTPIAIVIAGAMIAAAVLYQNGLPTDQPAGVNAPTNAAAKVQNDIDPKLLALRPDDHVRGNRNADILLIEYSDLECPYCKKFDTIMKQVMGEYGNSGSVAWVYRHYPLDMIHPKARKEAEATECANELGGNEAFWKYLDRLYEITPSNNQLDLAKLPEIAVEVGLDVGAFNTCLSSGKYAERVQRDFENGVEAGVQGTPFMAIINVKTGKQSSISGAYPAEAVKAAIDSIAGKK